MTWDSLEFTHRNFTSFLFIKHSKCFFYLFLIFIFFLLKGVQLHKSVLVTLVYQTQYAVLLIRKLLFAKLKSSKAVWWKKNVKTQIRSQSMHFRNCNKVQSSTIQNIYIKLQHIFTSCCSFLINLTKTIRKTSWCK